MPSNALRSAITITPGYEASVSSSEPVEIAVDIDIIGDPGTPPRLPALYFNSVRASVTNATFSNPVLQRADRYGEGVEIPLQLSLYQSDVMLESVTFPLAR